ncbi:MAG: sulfatase [Mycobacterium sp.]|nr:sulfatase [Mycobacterium sp.]
MSSPSDRRQASMRTFFLAVVVGLLIVANCAGLASSSASDAVGGSAVATSIGVDAGTRPNIVFVLTDDLSKNLVRYMPALQALQRRGTRFTNYTVTDSLCCPSRASIFTGQFPHNTDVVSNVAPSGGYTAFQAHQNQRHTFAVSLSRAGYRTGFFGKYLNGYNPVNHPRNPPGWSDWGAVDGHGYRAYGYNMSVNGKIVNHGFQPRDYLTSVLDRMSRRFIRSAAAGGTPFALEVATFSPHSPYVAAPADLDKFQTTRQPRSPAFNSHPANAPRWLAERPLLTAKQIARGRQTFRKRVRCVQSLDRLLAHLQSTLRDVNQLANTIFVFSSDNGFHISDYGLTAGKQTAFDTDVNVPLVVAGPGIPAGSVSSVPVENIDLAPTFDQLAGARIPAAVDGHSAVPLLHGRSVPWRTLAAVEHVAVGQKNGDPDRQPPSAGRLPSYRALRSAQFTYVEYARGQREYYARSNDRYELDNTYRSLSHRTITALHRELTALTGCRGYSQCWRAAAPAR